MARVTARERALRAIEFRRPDRVPIMHSVLPGAHRKYGEGLAALLSEFPDDFLNVDYRSSDRTSRVLARGESYEDEWGVVWTGVSEDHLGQATGHPIADWSALKRYRFPDPLAGGEWEAARAAIEKDDGRRCVIARVGEFFERMQWLRGFENLMMDLAEGRRELNELADGIVDHHLKVMARWRGYDVDVYGFGDDWGTQLSLMIHPHVWRSFFKPRYRMMIEAAHEDGRRVHFHSDGNVTAIVPDLVELGVDVLNVQLPVMELSYLIRELRGKVCVRGGLDRQSILPGSSPEAVRAHVRDIYGAFGSAEGGWIGNGEIGPDVPLENARAMFEEIVACGAKAD